MHDHQQTSAARLRLNNSNPSMDSRCNQMADQMSEQARARDRATLSPERVARDKNLPRQGETTEQDGRATPEDTPGAWRKTQ